MVRFIMNSAVLLPIELLLRRTLVRSVILFNRIFWAVVGCLANSSSMNSNMGSPQFAIQYQKINMQNLLFIETICLSLAIGSITFPSLQKLTSP